MISSIEKVNSIVLDELIGASCYVKNYDGDMTECRITRVDMFISKSGIGVNVDLTGINKGTINHPTCVTLENYNRNTSYAPVGFLTPMSYCKFYSELG